LSIADGAETGRIILLYLPTFFNAWIVLDAAQLQQLDTNFMESYISITVAVKVFTTAQFTFIAV
jgi:hypothetical protein